jgi:tRNA U38,U39,U40 pseudouridine synthase TruA
MTMLGYSILHPEGILVLTPDAPLSKEDFNGLANTVDLYLATHTKLNGVMIYAKDFPGWKDFGAFTAHMHFVREHHQRVKRVAVVTDSKLADLVQALGKHFILAEVKHFSFSDEAQAMVWLKAE